MSRLALVVIVAVVMAGGGVAWSSAGAQDSDDQATAIADLQTRVAALETAVAGTPSAATPHGAEVATGPAGTRTNPIPFGATATVGGEWEVMVVDVLPDAYDAIRAEVSFGDPPPAEHQYFVAHISMTYVGSQEAMSAGIVEFSAVGASAVAAEECGVVHDHIPSEDIFSGGTVEGNECWIVRKDDVGSLVMYARVLLGVDDSRVFFSLQPSD